tara:strand:- start:494 stop:1081 length:588 start_codon:yes stop_codon:yes gene_type:complete
MIKRLFDLIFAIFGLILLLPFFLAISILIKIDSKGSIFFIQDRVGQDAFLFKIIKFRTMTTSEEIKSTISIKGDVRVTKFGEILRRYKIDELPELINIVRGEMSFVGPRPDVPGYADKLNGDARNILKLKPGITSLASLKYSNEELLLSQQKNPIDYNNNIIYPDKVKMNLNYYKNHNLWIDIKIIFATIFRLNY